MRAKSMRKLSTITAMPMLVATASVSAARATLSSRGYQATSRTASRSSSLSRAPRRRSARRLRPASTGPTAATPSRLSASMAANPPSTPVASKTMPPTITAPSSGTSQRRHRTAPPPGSASAPANAP